ncbi:Uncharacterised protein [uncultured archaeon]|nr:Uncharacterised protein [uncultured archaeon]
MKVPFGIVILSALNGLAGLLMLILALFSGIFIGIFHDVTHSIAGAFWLFTLGSIVIAVLVVIGVSSLLIAW